LAEFAAAAAPAASSVMYLCRLVVVAKMHRAARRGAAWRESRELDTCCCVLTDTGRPRPLSNVYFSVVDDRRTPAAAAAAAAAAGKLSARRRTVEKVAGVPPECGDRRARHARLSSH